MNTQSKPISERLQIIALLSKSTLSTSLIESDCRGRAAHSVHKLKDWNVGIPVIPPVETVLMSRRIAVNSKYADFNGANVTARRVNFSAFWLLFWMWIIIKTRFPLQFFGAI
jgi:hypothetical protein